jgi:hypothetical protein
MISSHQSPLSARPEVVRIHVDWLYSEWRIFGLALVQVIVHKASLKLVSLVGTYELVNGIMNTDLLERHSDYRHDKPPRRLNGTESLAVPANESSDLQGISQHCDGDSRRDSCAQV